MSFLEMPGAMMSPSEEISKLGPPKASGYVWSPMDATTRQPKERKQKGSYKYQGKSMILRRPKYSFQVFPDLKKGDTYENTVYTRQKYKGGGKEFHAAHTGKKPLAINGVKYKDITGNEVYKGWGGDAAVRGARTAQKAKLTTKKAKTYANSAERDHYLRAWRKFTNLQERSNAGEKISPMRSRSFAPLENQLPGYGGRTGSNWEFNGNKRVRKSLVYKARKQRGPVAEGAIAGGAIGGLTGAGFGTARGLQILASGAAEPEIRKMPSKFQRVTTRAMIPGITGTKGAVRWAVPGAALGASAGVYGKYKQRQKQRQVSKAVLPNKWNGMMQGIPKATKRAQSAKFQVFGPPGGGRTKMTSAGMNMPVQKPTFAKPLPAPKRNKVDMNKRPRGMWD